MPNDLLGPLKTNVERFRVEVRRPRRKIGATNRPRPVRQEPVHREPLSPEAVERIQRLQWARYLAWAFAELKRWKSRIPPQDYEVQYARLMEQRTALLALEKGEA